MGIHSPGRGLAFALTFAAAVVLAPVGVAAAAVNQASPPVVAQAIGGTGGSASTPSDPAQYGVGDSSIAGFPLQGGVFGVLSSGDVTVADDPNDDTGTSTNFGISDPTRGTANDPATLRVDLVAPGDLNCLSLDFKFLSEEFPEYVDAGFNDGFIAELDSTSWTIGPDPVTFEETLTAPGDFAAGYGDRVAVDTVGPTVVTEADAAGTTYDAATGILTAKTPITPGPHAVFLSVFDAGDSVYDSAVFVDNLRFSTEAPTKCQAADLFGGAVGVTAGSKKINFQGKNGTFDLFCTLPVGATDPCVGNVVISASVPSGNARPALRAKKSKIAKGSYSVAPQTTGQATLKLTKKGKRLFKEKSKSKGSAQVTNTVNDASASFKVKLKK